MKINNSFFVLTGGPGAGKTSVLEVLRNRGYLCLDEVARAIIQEQLLQGGDAVPWGNIPAYTQKMLDASVRQYLTCEENKRICFFDRGILDTYAYARLTQQEDIVSICQVARQYKYNQTVFLFPAWEEIYCTDTERKQDFEEAVRTYDVIKDTYQACGYKTIEVPKVGVEERVDFILGFIE